MDYKSVIEEQIRELQKLQDFNIKSQRDESVEVAKTIIELCMTAKTLGEQD